MNLHFQNMVSMVHKSLEKQFMLMRGI